jgi:hypothetical protein
MKLRIQRKTERSGTIVIQVHGELVGEGLGELRKVCGTTDGAFSLDLTNLRAADAEALRGIRALVGRGARLIGVSPYIALLLDREGGAGRSDTCT